MSVAVKAIAALTLAAALFAAGCGRKGDPEPPTPAAEKAQDEVEAGQGY